MSLINKTKFERVCLFRTCQNPVTTANHLWKTLILVIQSKNRSLTMYISCFSERTCLDVSRLVYNSNVSLIWPLGHGRFCSHSLWNKNKTFITVKCGSFRFHDIARAIFPGFSIFAYAAFQQQQFPSLNFNFVSVVSKRQCQTNGWNMKHDSKSKL